MRFFDNNTANPDAYYEPNSFNGPVEDPSVAEPPAAISGDADRYDHREGNDDYTQVGNLFRLFTPEQKQRLFTNIATAMTGVPAFIVERQLALFSKVDAAYGAGVREAWQRLATRHRAEPASTYLCDCICLWTDAVIF